MNKKWIGICDPDEAYVFQLAEYLEEKNIFPFAIMSFTQRQALVEAGEANQAELILVSESSYVEGMENLSKSGIIILNENGETIGNSLININKYQSCKRIVQDIMDGITEGGICLPPRISGTSKLTIIGNYSPVGRCLQTTFSLCLGQVLAKKKKVLYMNFESFSGFQQLFQKTYRADITDILYYFRCDREKFAYRLEGFTEKINGLDYIPPVMTYETLTAVSGEQWLMLFKEIEKTTDYEYLILDLTENIQGLLEILLGCTLIYTLTKEDRRAAAKIRQYEAVMQNDDYGGIMQKTKKCTLPIFRQIPDNPEMLTHGELADYIKKLIEVDLHE